MGLFKSIKKRFKHQDYQPQNADPKDSFDSNQYGRSSSGHVESLAPTSHSGSPHEPNEQKGDTGPQDLWQIAYEKLSKEDQKFLSTDRSSPQSSQVIDQEENGRTREKLDEVIRLTEQQYEDYRNKSLKITRGSGKDDIIIRDSAHRILNATLSFKDIICAISAFDPTNHAASAWTIVSLGLTMTKNHMDIRDALFRSSEFLADVLARCAFIEKTHYHNNQSETKDKIEKALIQVYVNILHYSARVQKQHKANIGKRMLESVTAVSNHPIIQIESSIKNDEQALHHWVQQNEHLQHQQSAEYMLKQIDTVINSIVDLHQKLDCFNLRVAEGASFDSYENQHDAQCLPGTREEILQQIKQWGGSAQGQCMFWLCGRAGTGKSTISQTVARMFKEQGQLGASFFFKRGGGDRGNAKRLFSTITRQLITAIPHLSAAVSNAINDNPDISTKSFEEQFQKLLFKPLSSLNQSQHTTNMLIVMDALDECDDEKDIKVILKLLPQLQAVNWKIFLTSRPESSIREILEGMKDNKHRDFILHEMAEPVIERDISTFLKHKLSEIRVKRGQNMEWPGELETQSLVKISVPLFICAATICRQLEDVQWDPDETLHEILKYPNGSEYEGTYMPVLDRLLVNQNGRRKKRLVEEFQNIIGIIILLKTPLSVASLSNLTGVPESVIDLRLNPLHSVLSVPDDKTEPVRLFHLSFRDFLLDPSIHEKTEFWVDEKKKHSEITLQCLRVMREGLRKDLCKLGHDGTQRKEIDQCLIEESIPPALQYSCCYWVQHLQKCENPMERMDDVYSFLQEHFLYWMEAMSILGLTSELVGMIDLTRQLLLDNESPLCAFLQDARRFILKTRYIADIAPLQLYSSGLIFAPTKSIIREAFKKNIPGWIYRSPEVEQHWSAELESLEGHSNWLTSVAFSKDGRLLASASRDRTVKLWDPASGALHHTLKGHSDWVMSVTFSEDGRLLASASDDHTVKLWDPATGALHLTLEGHSNWVMSVAFSTDGRLLASASYDRTVKLWDPATGALHLTLEGHSGRVASVAFSTDGRLLASASDDSTVKLWDPATGALRHTLEGHNDMVISVAFSTDGRLLASASSDHTVKLWDPATGTLRHTLEGHSGRVASVAFSTDGRLLASASDDRTIKLWDPATGALHHTLEGHSDRVASVAFSTDGRLLASASDDLTVKLWDPASSALGHTLEGHSKVVTLVVFSTDGRLLASASYDSTVKLWDPATGALRHTLESHSNMITSVAFSTDGRLLASASSYDSTVKLWDPATGALNHTLEGHDDIVASVAFSTDGRLLASASYDSTIKLWDPATGALHHTLEGHSNWVISVAFSTDGRLLASASSDRTIKLWDPVSGVLHHVLEVHGFVHRLSFAEDSSYLETDLGIINLPPSCANDNPVHPTQIEICVWDHEWVTIQGKKLLWLPSAYRPICVATRNGNFAMGHVSGRVIFFEFRL